MEQESKQLARRNRGNTFAVATELSSLSAMATAVTSRLRLQGDYFGNVDRRGFME